MAQRVALITGITAQDGSYLAELLLDTLESPRHGRAHDGMRVVRRRTFP